MCQVRGRQRPILLIFEVFHAYLPKYGGNLSMVMPCDLFDVFLKRALKYGLGAIAVSQRPSEIFSLFNNWKL